MSLTIAGRLVTKEQITGTLRLLRYYRAFLASNYERCRDPSSDCPQTDAMTKDQVRRRLTKLIHTAINRKAGIPDPEDDIELWRDVQLVNHLIHRNNPSALQWRWTGMKRFRTRWIQRRYGFLLSDVKEDD